MIQKAEQRRRRGGGSAATTGFRRADHARRTMRRYVPGASLGLQTADSRLAPIQPGKAIDDQ